MPSCPNNILYSDFSLILDTIKDHTLHLCVLIPGSNLLGFQLENWTIYIAWWQLHLIFTTIPLFHVSLCDQSWPCIFKPDPSPFFVLHHIPTHSQSKKAPNCPGSSLAVPWDFAHFMPSLLQFHNCISYQSWAVSLNWGPVLRPLILVWYLVSLFLATGKRLWLRFPAVIFPSFCHSKY